MGEGECARACVRYVYASIQIVCYQLCNQIPLDNSMAVDHAADPRAGIYMCDTHLGTSLIKRKTHARSRTPETKGSQKAHCFFLLYCILL